MKTSKLNLLLALPLMTLLVGCAEDVITNPEVEEKAVKQAPLTEVDYIVQDIALEKMLADANVKLASDRENFVDTTAQEMEQFNEAAGNISDRVDLPKLSSVANKTVAKLTQQIELLGKYSDLLVANNELLSQQLAAEEEAIKQDPAQEGAKPSESKSKRLARNTKRVESAAKNIASRQEAMEAIRKVMAGE